MALLWPVQALWTAGGRAGSGMWATAAAAAVCSFSSNAAPANAMALIKQLRERSGAPITDVKACLTAEGWDPDAAYEALRRKGLAAAAKKAGRHAAEGLVGLATAPGGQVAAIVEINSETDFVARNDLFQGLVRDAAAALLATAATTTTTTSSAAAGHNPGVTVATIDEAQLATLACGPGSLAARVAEVGAAVREAIKVRRGFLVTTQGGLLGAYCHQPVAPGLGRIATLVALQPSAATSSSSSSSGGGGGADLQPAAPLAQNLAMHVAGLRPLYTEPSAVPPHVLDAERAVLAAAAGTSGKPAAVVDKMVAGRLKKWYQEVCLLEQRYLLDDSLTVAQLLAAQGKELVGQPLAIAGHLRVQVGEGLDTAETPDFAAEVSAMASKQ